MLLSVGKITCGEDYAARKPKPCIKDEECMI
jgi:hypothetical protein